MDKSDKIAELEAVLAQFLKPIKNLPFPVVVKAMAGQQVIPIDLTDAEDRKLVDTIRAAARSTGEEVRRTPIRRNRPNEVGNDIEPFVQRALVATGFRAERPKGRTGRGKQTGYPDLLVFDDAGRPSYIECKVFGEGKALTTMRSFYLSPSEDFKVCCDARHLLLAFSIHRTPINGSQNSNYVVTSFKLMDLSGLKCDVKYEFNSDNKRLYASDMQLAAGPV